VAWYPAHNPFQADTAYTATVILTANANYTFTGLPAATINGNTASITYNTGTSVTLSYQFPATAATTYHRVTFDSNGGSDVAYQNVYPGGLVPIRPTPTRTNNIFAGWYREAALSTAWNFATDTVAGNITLYAKWVEFEMVQVSAGTFMMGSPDTEPGRSANEGPQHQVTLTSGFWVGIYPVTQAQFQAVMGSNPSEFQAIFGFPSAPPPIGVAENRPVERVSWYAALVFCNRLSVINGRSPAYEMQRADNPAIWSTDPDFWGSVPASNDVRWNAVRIVTESNGYRLPTEAQWEYTCRAGITAAFNWGTNFINDTQANYRAHVIDANNTVAGTTIGATTEVGSYDPNAWGLYDMSGNVWEWCWDGLRTYTSVTSFNPVGPLGTDRVMRGGSWNYSGQGARSAFRASNAPHVRLGSRGFRVVRPE
jgi:uncharacterized repeat protein (TIGR02543 family)